jgi:AcrR family transcriptional regulator
MSEPLNRRQRKKEQTRRTIADAAMKLFMERGFDEVTIAEVAEAADVSINTIFNHYPTKEDLFFGSDETMETELTRVAQGRRPGESVIALLRRSLTETIDRLDEGTDRREDIAYWAGLRHVLLGSRALQIRAVQIARGAALAAESALAASLAEDVAAGPEDPTPRLVASQVLALYSTLLMQAEQRRRAGQRPEELRAFLRAAAEIALQLLERGIGDYGARRG